MRLEFARVIRPIRLAEYAEELGEVEIRVWLNVPTELIDRIRDLKTMKDVEIYTWLREVWIEGAQVSAETGEMMRDPFTEEEIRMLFEHCMQNDPALWGWLMQRTIGMIFEYRFGVKKA